MQEMHKRLRLAVDEDIGPTNVLAAFVCGDFDNSKLYVASFGTGKNQENSLTDCMPTFVCKYLSSPDSLCHPWKMFYGRYFVEIRK